VGCQACMACKTGLEHCAVEDELSPVLEAVAEADGLVLASPVYFSDVSAQAKAFIDRCYSFLRPNFPKLPRPGRLDPGKKAVMILTQGYAEPKLCEDVYPRYEKHLRHIGFDQTHLIRACGVGALGAAAADDGLMRKAEDAARWLLV
jgi:multimeric flavodoxin WrbA